MRGTATAPAYMMNKCCRPSTSNRGVGNNWSTGCLTRSAVGRFRSSKSSDGVGRLRRTRRQPGQGVARLSTEIQSHLPDKTYVLPESISQSGKTFPQTAAVSASGSDGRSSNVIADSARGSDFVPHTHTVSPRSRGSAGQRQSPRVAGATLPRTSTLSAPNRAGFAGQRQGPHVAEATLPRRPIHSAPDHAGSRGNARVPAWREPPCPAHPHVPDPDRAGLRGQRQSPRAAGTTLPRRPTRSAPDHPGLRGNVKVQLWCKRPCPAHPYLRPRITPVRGATSRARSFGPRAGRATPQPALVRRVTCLTVR